MPHRVSLPSLIKDKLVRLSAAEKRKLTAEAPDCIRAFKEADNPQSMKDAIERLRALAYMSGKIQALLQQSASIKLLLHGPFVHAPSYYADLTEHACRNLTALMDAAAIQGPVRPSEPTVEFCLLRGFEVRWEGEVSLQPKLWLILKFFLSRKHYPCSVGGL